MFLDFLANVLKMKYILESALTAITALGEFWVSLGKSFAHLDCTIFAHHTFKKCQAL
jgi:succinate-acetate transporter protein